MPRPAGAETEARADGLEAMRCPTCGHGVRKEQEVCTYCGAFLQDAHLAEGKGEVIFSGDEQRPAMPGKAEHPVEPAEPLPPELEEFEEEEEVAPEEGRFKKPPPPPPPPQPKLPGWLRILFPLLFILIPLLNCRFRGSVPSSRPDEKPVLQQALFCENIAEGRPVNPTAVFSLGQHQRVVLYTRWSGTGGTHSFSFRWYTPEGRLQPASSRETQFQFGRGNETFSTSAVLPLREGMLLGRWRVEIAVDGAAQERPSFELRE